MSWAAWIDVEHGEGYSSRIDVVDGHTYNLTPMWARAGVFDVAHDLQGKTCRELAKPLRQALVDAVTCADEYRALEPENGWGDYAGFLKILTRFTELVHAHPSGVVEWYG